ncbi:FAD-binding domain-containing protein [Mycena kentingensis (nom. inval.)]|nr:FAD-binding domain-containing protein [Mycena kentingensis (nom. inval.)]
MLAISLLFFASSALAGPAAPSTLVSCLASKNLTFETSQFTTTPFNTRFHYTPSAIVYPNKTSEVAEAVQCAAKHGTRVSPLSGGHSYSASGFGADGTLVVSLRSMAKLDYIAADGTVNVEPGIHLGDFALELDTHGRAAAHGICPYVGYVVAGSGASHLIKTPYRLGGHAGFGGWGLASRSWGLLIDQIIAAEVVLADGNVRIVDNNDDLFWALRGASASFGIVTRYTIQTHEAPATVQRFAINFNKRPASEFSRILQQYQQWSLHAPKEIGIVANVWQSGTDIEMTGYYMGTKDNFDPVFDSLLKATGQPDTIYRQEREWKTALTEVSGGSTLSTVGTPDIHDTFYAKSLVVPEVQPISTAAFEALADYFNRTKKPDEISEWFIQFELWGGGDSKIATVHSADTAYPHRSHHWTVQFYGRSKGSWSSQSTEYVDGLVEAITDKMPEVKFGGYANYLDPELKGWEGKYYGSNYPRLLALQKQYDPKGVFAKPQNIGSQ